MRDVSGRCGCLCGCSCVPCLRGTCLWVCVLGLGGSSAGCGGQAHALVMYISGVVCETVPETGEVARFPAETLGTHIDGNTEYNVTSTGSPTVTPGNECLTKQPHCTIEGVQTKLRVQQPHQEWYVCMYVYGHLHALWP
jgi:hypothetical protein